MAKQANEGYVQVPGGKVWYRIVGSGGSVPLLTLHGGPGAGHDYFEPLEELASDDRRVVFFDQLGCGRSEQPDDKSLWRIDRFVQEVDAVRKGLDLDLIHLLGHSWGGWLAIEYMLNKPKGVASLILSGSSASIPEFVAEAERLKSELPPNTRDTLRKYEARADYKHPEYEAAVMEFYKRHLCRLDRWPDSLVRSVHNMTGNQVYETINGPNEFIVIGNLKDWNRADRLGEINVPTLITVGRYDEVTPKCSETLYRGIKGSEFHLFAHSGHFAMLEEPTEYRLIVMDFIARVENKIGHRYSA